MLEPLPDPEQRDEWLARLRRGDESAFETIYTAYAERLWRFAHGYVRDADVAEDLVHDVFLSLWDRRKRIEAAHLGVYLYGATRNRALQWLRHGRVVERTVTSDAVGSVGTPSAPPTPDEDLLTREIDTAIASALATMPEARRTAFRLRWEDELSFPEIATIMGISVEAAQMHLARARTVLRQALARFRNDAGPGGVGV